MYNGFMSEIPFIRLIQKRGRDKRNKMMKKGFTGSSPVRPWAEVRNFDERKMIEYAEAVAQWSATRFIVLDSGEAMEESRHLDYVRSMKALRKSLADARAVMDRLPHNEPKISTPHKDFNAGTGKVRRPSSLRAQRMREEQENSFDLSLRISKDRRSLIDMARSMNLGWDIVEALTRASNQSIMRGVYVYRWFERLDPYYEDGSRVYHGVDSVVSDLMRQIQEK